MTTIDHEQVLHLFALEQSAQIFEKLVTVCYQSILTPGDTSVDCGAHKGWHTLPMAAAVGRSGRVHAFEAIPSLVQELGKLIEREQLYQIELHGKAVSSAPGEATFHWVRNGEGVSGLRKRDVSNLVPVADVEIIQVPVTTLDLLPLGALERWRFCKLDIEGAELDAMRGAERSILRHRPVLVFENGRGVSASVYGYTRDDYFDFFNRLGYKQFDLFGRDFGPEQWDSGFVPWNTIAVAAGSSDEVFIRQQYPQLLRDVQFSCE